MYCNDKGLETSTTHVSSATYRRVLSAENNIEADQI